ncbi:MAG: phosphotransferase, partial [Paracoccaceae bacterium]
MMFGQLRDPLLPALETLNGSDLSRITGKPQPRLLRARYQPGTRAILHVALGAQQDADEGAIWFYAGNKAQRLARHLPGARLDPPSGALFEAFPHDHRMPLLATFVEGAMGFADRLIGGPAASPPQLMRYRPGLSATFCWTREDGRRFFVKQTRDDDVHVRALVMSHLADAARGLAVSFSTAVGVIPELGLIAYDAARGQSLDSLLPGIGTAPIQGAIAQVTSALRALWSLPVVPDRVLDRTALLRRVGQASQIISILDAEAGRSASALAILLQSCPVRVRMRPIHGDMKLEHAFLSGSLTTLIDMESLSLGDPDYDLAKLDARVTMAEVTGQITADKADVARAEIRRHAGPHYDWFLTCARLQCAKFFAQRFDPATVPQMRRILT